MYKLIGKVLYLKKKEIEIMIWNLESCFCRFEEFEIKNHNFK